MEESKYISLIYGGKGLTGQFGFEKMYLKLAFISSFTHFCGEEFLVLKYGCVIFVTFRKSGSKPSAGARRRAAK